MPQVTQDPNAHLPYDIEWNAWLAARNLQVTDIINFTWVVPANITKTNDVQDGTVSRVYLKQLALGEKATVTCRIICTNPDGGEAITDDFSFEVVGKHQ